MADFITFDDLLRIKSENGLNESQILTRTAKSSGKNIFLSHASKDNAYLTSVIQILENHGGIVYTDNGDNRLPQPPSDETATILRTTINDLPKFVLFVTTNSKNSKWIPWELGLADAYKGYDRIALFPSSKFSSEQEWANQEYLGLYQRIVWGRIKKRDPEWVVKDAFKNEAITLRRWLNPLLYG